MCEDKFCENILLSEFVDDQRRFAANPTILEHYLVAQPENFNQIKFRSIQLGS